MKNVNIRKRIDLIQEKAKSLLQRMDLVKYNKNNELEKIIIENKKTIAENISIIEEQSFIINEMQEVKNDKYNDFTSDLLSDMNYETILGLTKNKEIAFDNKHPFINNIKFIKDLMDYFIETEEYEECSYLQTLV